jgi:hypothetical protein
MPASCRQLVNRREDEGHVHGNDPAPFAVHCHTPGGPALVHRQAVRGGGPGDRDVGIEREEKYVKIALGRLRG